MRKEEKVLTEREGKEVFNLAVIIAFMCGIVLGAGIVSFYLFDLWQLKIMGF